MTKPYKVLLPEKIEDMQDGVVYRGKSDYNSYIIVYCIDCRIPMKVVLSHGKPKWERCRDCENKRRVKYLELPDRIEDMVEGVIYKDKWRAACILHPCEICGNHRVVRLINREPEVKICHPCSNQTPEKREIMRNAHLGIPISEEQKQKQSQMMKEKVATDSKYRQHLLDLAESRIGIPLSEETKQKLHEANKGKMPSESCLVAREKRMAELMVDEEYRNRCSRAVLLSLKLEPTESELELDGLLQRYFPSQWVYNGDNSQDYVVYGLVPDFISRIFVDKVIELFGYHHSAECFSGVKWNKTEEGRKEVLKQYGKDCLVIWVEELENPLAVVQKVKEFVGVS
jgi:hypothetical protein